MRELTKNEIKFIKETGWTPTVSQCGEWHRTIWTKDKISLNDACYAQLKNAYDIKYSGIAHDFAKKHYEIDLNKLYQKFVEEGDGISLENEATYLFYLFFTKEELEKMTDKEATQWLKDFQYYYGYRKWDEGNLTYVQEALEVYEGSRKFYLEDDDSVWNLSITEYPDSPVWERPERVLDI